MLKSSVIEKKDLSDDRIGFEIDTIPEEIRIMKNSSKQRKLSAESYYE